MFAQFSNQQRLADALKCLVDTAPVVPGNRADRRRALRALAAFEAAGWHPDVFEKVVDEEFKIVFNDGEESDVMGNTFEFHADGSVKYLYHVKTALFLDVAELLEIYVGEVMRQPLGYTVEEAAKYLGITPRTLKYHVHKSKRLHGEVKGHTLLFTQAQLDRFRTLDFTPGPKPEAEPA